MSRSDAPRAISAMSVRGNGTSSMSQSHQTPVAADVEITARILSIFNAKGLRSTRQRRLIAERLATLATHAADFTTQDLWREVQSFDPHLGRATVYRSVDVLLDEGVLDRVSFPDGTHRYRVCAGSRHHHHVTCVQCQRVVEVEACLPAELIAAISSDTSFAIEGHSLERFGRCAACQRAQLAND